MLSASIAEITAWLSERGLVDLARGRGHARPVEPREVGPVVAAHGLQISIHRDPQRALALARRLARRTRGGIPTYDDTLAAALAAAGRFEEAAEIATRAAEICRSAGVSGLAAEIDRRIVEAEDQLARLNYTFDRKFIFRVLAMGHSQFAEYIGARGPNTQINSACASTTTNRLRSTP